MSRTRRAERRLRRHTAMRRDDAGAAAFLHEIIMPNLP